MIEKDLGRRRRSFRLLDGQTEYDLCASRALEKQERYVIGASRVFWPSKIKGTYRKNKGVGYDR